ncbi:MAG: PilZ domain-containing protein [Acidobacteria bacterium]|nr:PilZ domain-containing protein [Acidobacteriota bacterium]MCZ6769780.1 PilZ domain-containing protein [Acidobacteriota bacterium]MCZ6878942.1 PilZ domain-containing protein [Acidobacteriota bacterium]
MREPDRREFKRLRLPFRGTATFSDHGQKKVEARNISVASAYLIADTKLSIGEAVKLFMRWPPEDNLPGVILKANGTVLRVEKLSKKAWGCVVKFEQMPDLVWKT